MRKTCLIPVFLLLCGPLEAAEDDRFAVIVSLGGQGIGIGVAAEYMLAGSHRLAIGQGHTADPTIIDGDTDRRKTRYINYVHASAAPGTHPEWAIGPMQVVRTYNRAFSDSRDFEVEAFALTGALGLRHNADNGWFSWRFGVSPIWFRDRPQPPVYNDNIIYRAYISAGISF